LQRVDLSHPSLHVFADGIPMAGIVAAEIASNNHYAADRFRLTVQATPSEFAAWSETSQSLLDIQVTLDGSTPTSLIQGEVDQVRLDAATYRLVLEGRDLTARLIEARTQENFTNQTSSEIAEILAARHDLRADIHRTSTPIGAYWQLEHDRITLDAHSRSSTEWDLLVALAGQEGFNVGITGNTLHFGPDEATPSAIPILTQADCISLELERSLTLARDIEVTVKSWNSRQAHAFSQTARATRGAGRAGRHSRPQTFITVIPNLTPDAAMRLAQSRLAELTRHERVVSAEMPGELDLAPRQQIRIEGTNTSFDQLYWIDEIIRRIDVHHGFTQHLRARNTTAKS
jgi:phage protein D